MRRETVAVQLRQDRVRLVRRLPAAVGGRRRRRQQRVQPVSNILVDIHGAVAHVVGIKVIVHLVGVQVRGKLEGGEVVEHRLLVDGEGIGETVVLLELVVHSGGRRRRC